MAEVVMVDVVRVVADVVVVCVVAAGPVAVTVCLSVASRLSRATERLSRGENLPFVVDSDMRSCTYRPVTLIADHDAVTGVQGAVELP
jgi:hypothetical protein